MTVRFCKLIVKRNCDEEKLLTSRFAQLKLQTAHSEDDKAELERIKIKLSDFQTEKTRGAIIRSRARWYEHGEKNSKYFLNLEKLNYRRKHISSLINQNGTKINDPKEILNEERNFFKELYSSTNVAPNSEEFSDLFTALFTNTRTLKFKNRLHNCVFRCRQSYLRSQAMNLETQKHTKRIQIRQSQITNLDLLNPFKQSCVS